MSIGRELKNLINSVSGGGGELHFLAGTRTVNYSGGSNLARTYYQYTFMPNIKYFLKDIKRFDTEPKLPFKMGFNKGKINKFMNRQRIYKQGIRNLPKNPNQPQNYITWDSQLDPERVMKFDFKEQSLSSTKGTVGVVIMEDPFPRRYHRRRRLRYIGGRKDDLASILMKFMHICPLKNPMLKRIIGMEIAKYFSNKGENVQQEGSDLVVYAKTVSGFFSKIIEKTIDAYKWVGKKIEKNILGPTREFLKKKVPAVWNAIDSIDRKMGITKTLKKWSGEVEKIANKYGGMVMNIAVMAAATITGTASAVGPLLALADKATDLLTKKDKKVLKDIAKVGGDVSKIPAKELNTFTTRVFGKLKSKMIEEKGKEGAFDFKKLVDIAKDTVDNVEKEKKEAKKKKTTSGITIDILPFRPKSSMVLAGFLTAS